MRKRCNERGLGYSAAGPGSCGEQLGDAAGEAVHVAEQAEGFGGTRADAQRGSDLLQLLRDLPATLCLLEDVGGQLRQVDVGGSSQDLGLEALDRPLGESQGILLTGDGQVSSQRPALEGKHGAAMGGEAGQESGAGAPVLACK